jgi:deazaflavin-dependent oxidoreductase (nitroreductase family)
MATATETFGDERYCVLTTSQRVTGRRHTTELPFVPAEGGVYVLSTSGGLSTWCLNLQAEPQAVVRIGTRTWLGRAAFLEPDDPRREAVRRAFLERHGEVDRDREGGWSDDVIVAHVVFTRELS